MSFTVPSGQGAGQTVQFDQLRIEPIATPGRGNYNFQGRRYLLTWREGNNQFSWHQARNYCQENGMRIISLDSPIVREHFFRLVRTEGVEFFWTGGHISPDKQFVEWENGAGEGISQGFHPWSTEGLRGAQPDGPPGEMCLAVLNNVFNVSCQDANLGLLVFYLLLRTESSSMMLDVRTPNPRSVKLDMADLLNYLCI